MDQKEAEEVLKKYHYCLLHKKPMYYKRGFVGLGQNLIPACYVCLDCQENLAMQKKNEIEAALEALK